MESSWRRRRQKTGKPSARSHEPLASGRVHSHFPPREDISPPALLAGVARRATLAARSRALHRCAAPPLASTHVRQSVLEPPTPAPVPRPTVNGTVTAPAHPLCRRPRRSAAPGPPGLGQNLLDPGHECAVDDWMRLNVMERRVKESIRRAGIVR